MQSPGIRFCSSLIVIGKIYYCLDVWDYGDFDLTAKVTVIPVVPVGILKVEI